MVQLIKYKAEKDFMQAREKSNPDGYGFVMLQLSFGRQQYLLEE
jgi:hypothetical protein